MYKSQRCVVGNFCCRGLSLIYDGVREEERSLGDVIYDQTRDLCTRPHFSWPLGSLYLLSVCLVPVVHVDFPHIM